MAQNNQLHVLGVRRTELQDEELQQATEEAEQQTGGHNDQILTVATILGHPARTPWSVHRSRFRHPQPGLGAHFGRHHLERVLAEFVSHYNHARPHRGIDLDAPIPIQPVTDTSGVVERVDRLGGLIHEYSRAA